MSIIIKEKDSVIEKRMLEAMLDYINSRIPLSYAKIRKDLESFILDAITNNTTGQAILNGDLVGEFGFPRDSKDRLNELAEMIATYMEFDFIPFKRASSTRISGSLKVRILRSDFIEVLSSQASVVRAKVGNLPWLEWLLTEGNHIIISDYFVHFQLGVGRSGRAVMVYKEGTSWSVPKEHAGTLRNNWLTRAVKTGDFQDAAETVIVNAIESVI